MHMSLTSLANLARLGRGITSHRHSSYDTTGGNRDFWPVPAGQTLTLGEMSAPGCIRHIWMTTGEDDNNLRRLVLRMYWDGADTPAVACPIGDFFGLGHAKASYFTSAPLQASYLAMNCFFPMPYARGARITITNDSPKDSFLYFYIDYHQWPQPDDSLGRFHACWRRELVRRKAGKEVAF